MFNVLTAIGIFLSLHFITNLLRLLRCKYFLEKYLQWLNDKTWGLVQHQDEVVNLFKKAGVNDSSIPVVQPAGYGQIMTATTSLFLNFPSDREDAANITVSMFHRAIGVYRKRMLNTFNPLYWIELVINLPKQTLMYLGVPAESLFTKIAQFIYWSLGVAFTLAVSFFKPELDQFIRNLLEQLGNG